MPRAGRVSRLTLLGVLTVLLWVPSIARAAPPDAPQSFTAVVDGSTVTLNWVPPTTGPLAESYRIEAALNAGGAVVTWIPITTGTSLTVPNVPNGIFFVRVRAINADGPSGPSNEVVIVVGPGPGCTSPPNAPASLGASVAGEAVTLDWSPSIGACAPTHYLVGVGRQPGGVQIGTFVLSLQTTITASAVPPGTYFARVAASNVFGTSSTASNEVTFTVTGGCTAPPNTPGPLSGSVIGSIVSLNWGASAGGCAATSYVVQAGRSPGSIDVTSASVGGATSVSASAPTGTYFVRVVAVNAFGPSAPSNELTLTVASTPATVWSVTQRFASVSGPDNCWVRQQRARLTGVVFAGLRMEIRRSAGSFTVDGFGLWTGTTNGNAFSASQPLEGGGGTCDGSAYLQRPGVSNLSGRFSDDDQLFTATEVNSYYLTTGELVTYVWGWEGRRQN